MPQSPDAVPDPLRTPAFHWHEAGAAHGLPSDAVRRSILREAMGIGDADLRQRARRWPPAMGAHSGRSCAACADARAWCRRLADAHPAFGHSRSAEPALLPALARRGISRPDFERAQMVPHAAIPVDTVFGLDPAFLLEGAAVAGATIAQPGPGAHPVGSISARDLPKVQAVVLIAALLFVMVNLATDLFCRWIDPRIGAPDASCRRFCSPLRFSVSLWPDAGTS